MVIPTSNYVDISFKKNDIIIFNLHGKSRILQSIRDILLTKDNFFWSNYLKNDRDVVCNMINIKDIEYIEKYNCKNKQPIKVDIDNLVYYLQNIRGFSDEIKNI